MKKSLSFLTALMLVLAFIFTLNISNVKVSAEELSDEEKVQAELNNITVPETAIIDFPVVSVSAHGATIKWESNNESVLDVEENGGWVKVTRPTDEDKVVTLKVTLTLNNASDSRSFEVKVLKGVTVTNEYSINYVLNGGSNNPNNPTKYKVGQNPVINAPTKGTVEFLGWYLNDSFTGEKVTSLPKGTSGDVTLYAKWAPATLTKIEITTQPTKLVYNALETFDASGIKVTAIYNDNHEEDVTSKVEYDKQQLHGDDTEVVVSYMGQTAKVAVTVNKLTYDLSGITFESASKQYNGEAQTLAYSGTLPQGLSATVDGVATNVSEGAVTIKLVFTNSNERDYVTPAPIERTLTITKAPLTVTADSKSMQVGATLPELTISYEGFKGNDNESVLSVLPSVSTNATSASPAGQYAITITKDATASNYEITFVDGVLSINAGSYTIEATSSLKVTYSGSAQSFTAVVKDGANPIDVELTYTLNGNPFTGAINVGSYNVLVSYDDETYGKGSTTITFVVEAKALEASMFEALPEVSYTGSAHQPKVNGTYNNKALVEGTDYSLSYENNIEKGTAHVIVKGLTNYSGEVTLDFKIGDSDLERVTEAKDSLQNVNVVAGTKVPTSHENGSAIFWASTSTALSVNESGVVTTVQTNVEQEVVVYAIITKGNAAEYAKFTVTVPASSTGDAPVVGESVVTNSNVTVSNIPTELGVKGVTVVETEQEGYAYAYDIKLLNANNQEVELNGAKVTVKLPGTFVVGKTYQVYHIGVTEEMVAEVTATSTEYIEFETTHFSVYAVKEKETQGEEPSETTTATVVIADYAAANGWTNGIMYNTIDINGKVSVVAAAKDNGGNTGKYYTSGNQWRVYQSDTEAKVTFTAENNVNIISVKITYSISNTGTLVLGETNVSSDEVVNINASSVTFSVGNTGTANNGQVRITAIEVVYTSSNGGTVTPEPSHELVPCEICGKCTKENCDVESHEKCEGHEETPEPSHELVPCETCGKCKYENCDVESHEKCEGHEVVNTNVSIAEAVQIASGYEHNTYSEIKYTVTGIISNLYNTTYGNFHLVDENGNDLTIYGLYQNNIRYDAMEIKPQVGDTVTLTGILGSYNETPQMKNAELDLLVAPNRTVSVSVNNELMGSATIDKDNVENGDKVTLTIIVNEGYEISAIKVNGVNTTSSTREFIITSNTTIVVEFKEVSQGGGEIVETQTASLSFADKAQRTSLSTSEQVWEQNGVKLTNLKGSSTTNVADYANPARFYKSSSITIEVANGSITKIEFTANSASYATALQSSITEGTVTVSGSVVTVEFDSPVSSYTIASLTGGQVRMNSLVVTYVPNSSN